MSDNRQPKQYRFCTACGAEHAIGARFCGRCGAALCTTCGATARAGSRYCLRCGNPLNRQSAPPPPPLEPVSTPRGPLPQSQPLFPADASPWLVEFVDREEILLEFQRLVAGTLETRRIILLKGTKGIGKSFLLRRLQSQCRQQQVSHVLIALADPRGVDDIKIMRDVRDSLGEEEFKSFTDLLNHYTMDGYTLKLQVEVVNRDDRSGGGIAIQDQAQVDGVVAGRDAIVIRDNLLSAPRRDIEIDRRRMQDALTRRFLEALVAACSKRKIVCMFDDIDRLEETTANWFWRDILGQLIAQANFLAVLTAAEEPVVDRWVSAAIENTSLSNLPEPHVVEYLERRGVPTDDLRGVTGFIMSDIGGHGNPEKMAQMVDIYLKPRPGATP